MKKTLLPLLALSATAFLWNCSDSSSPSNPVDNSATSVSSSPYYLGGFVIDPATGIVSDLASGTSVGQLNADGTVTSLVDGSIILAADTTILPSISASGLLINKNGVVTDLNGTPVGTLNADGQTITLVDGSVTDLLGNVISGPIVTVSSAAGEVVVSSASVLPLSSAAVVPTSSESSVLPGVSSATASVTGSSSSAQQSVSGSVTVSGSLTQTVGKNQSVSTVVFSGVSAEPSRSWNLYWLQTSYDQNAGTYTISGTVPEYFQEGTTSENFTFADGAFTFTLNVGSATVVASSASQQVVSSSSAQQAVSSSSVKSSSSSAKSSSSAASTTTGTDLVYVSGGASGTGWATRYWDCCKPSCSWTENAGSGNETKMCSANGKTEISNYSTTSVCNGGSAATCTSQIPIIVNDNLAYAFAAVPASNGGQCGHCYALTFDGTGKYETKNPQQSIKGKVLVVMASNVGTDVEQGQFDVMIPGGGLGIYNGCSAMGWGDQGEQYGGLLSTCENKIGWNLSGTNLTTKRKECLSDMCKTVFANDAVAQEGCMFLVNWMNAAGNPNHSYKEVECPAALKAAYR